MVHRQHQSQRSNRKSVLRFLELVLLMAIVIFAASSTLVISFRLLREKTEFIMERKDVSENMVVYELQEGVKPPQFGDMIPDPTQSQAVLVPSPRSNNDNKNINNLIPIDQVHRQGLYHTGTWQHVIDSEHRLLLLKRGPQLVTCPNAWALPGEHSLGWESPLETAQRGVREELGIHVMKHIQSYQLLTPDPVYYIRDYGPTNGNRIDRQVVYLWWIQLTVPGSQAELELDEEVADFQWVTLPEIQDKIRLAKDQENEQQSASNNYNHDNEDVWYCDVTLLRLFALGLAKLKEHLQNHTTTLQTPHVDQPSR